MEIGRDGVCVPARVTPTRAHPSLNSPHTMRVFFGMETPLRERSGGHTGTAPTVSFGWIARGWLVSLRVDCVCGFVCWENGAHEPTPSVLYFCQPRVD